MGGNLGRSEGRRGRRVEGVRKKWKVEGGKRAGRWIQGEDRLDYLMTRKRRKAERRFPRRGMRLHCCRFHCL